MKAVINISFRYENHRHYMATNIIPSVSPFRGLIRHAKVCRGLIYRAGFMSTSSSDGDFAF